MYIATVKYNIATYEGTIDVDYDSDSEEDEVIIAKAKQILKRKSGEFPIGYQCWRIIKRHFSY